METRGRFIFGIRKRLLRHHWHQIRFIGRWWRHGDIYEIFAKRNKGCGQHCFSCITKGVFQFEFIFLNSIMWLFSSEVKLFDDNSAFWLPLVVSMKCYLVSLSVMISTISILCDFVCSLITVIIIVLIFICLIACYKCCRFTTCVFVMRFVKLYIYIRETDI